MLFRSVSVVGRPIAVMQTNHPTMEEMEEVQGRYIVELKRRVSFLFRSLTLADDRIVGRIWDDHKEIYALGRTKELTIIA